MKRWQKGQVTLLQAAGIRKGKVQYPPFNPTLPTQVAQSSNPGNTGASGGGAGNPAGTSDQANQALGKQMAAAVGWTGAQWDALNNIAMAESGWNATATNKSSGAYGIPQSLPGSKMAASGSDWQTNPRTQIAWMLGYIRSTYGNPVNAWQFHLAHNWY
jgi:hypothetical protein